MHEIHEDKVGSNAIPLDFVSATDRFKTMKPMLESGNTSIFSLEMSKVRNKDTDQKVLQQYSQLIQDD